MGRVSDTGRRGWAVVATLVMALLSLGPVALSAPAGAVSPRSVQGVVGVADNFWLVTPTGGVEAYGVPSYGAPTGLNQPIVAAVTDHALSGYWLVASDGGVFAYGTAPFYGSTGNLHLNQPIVGMAQTPDDRGYWLVAADGGVFSFGRAAFYGSTGNIRLNQPIVALTAVANGHGYWMVAADGGVFAFGDAGYYGSAAGSATEPVRRLVPTGDDNGYWLVQQNGTAQAFGGATGQSILPQTLLFQPITPGDQAVLFALLQLGKPYIYGGNGPVGYDCSGLALASWEHGAGIGFARVADDQYHTAGIQITLDQLEAGDLVFWGTNTADWTTVYHTAIYVGGGRIVEATGDVVQLNTLDQWGTDQVMPFARRP